ncbi:MerR family transcriptional regulator [Paenibacillus piri]|uniref:Methyltransferase domain-containing protein n=1 Tax=Paenibacillus piri TaxID=2547395 RepID=A0A4R5KCY3_9BACL|nr:methyltransferase domain-containing protein [Paenibacillus piri]TDF92358.1 methyltransferase domain-containing protein [Paenibacillus piri]
MKIKDAAAKLNISPRAIRFYEEKGLIAPAKQVGNQYRSFSEKEIWRLQTVISLREAGMTIEDIKKALAQAENIDQEELLYYLEMQRSVMFSQWLELKQIIETTDRMIELVRKRASLPLDDIFVLADGSKKLRELRTNWTDKWNFDHQALTHDERILNDANEYKDYDQALRQVVQWVAPKAGERGLDIGTGTGNLAGKFLLQGIRMAAVDQSMEMLKQASRKYAGLEVKRGNFLAIPYMDGQFDFIVTTFALHHITDEQKQLALGEMRRVLKPHGTICIADLMFENASHRDAYLTSLNEQGHTGLADAVQNKYYSVCPSLLQWFEDNGYITKHRQINELLHIVYAVPIR